MGLAQVTLGLRGQGCGLREPARDLASRELAIADLSSIRAALAARITAGTGLRTLPEAKDQVSPPVAVILPGQPVVTYGATLDGAFTVNLRVLLLLSDAAPVEKVQRALDAYLGIGVHDSVPASIAGAIQDDPTLGHTVHFAVPLAADSYGRVDYAGATYFGARLTIQAGAI
jgi:hypothetical protein